MLLKNRTAIVTGATRGIGRAIAFRLAKEGANIAFNYASSEAQAETLKKEIEALGVGCLASKVDIRDYDATQKFKNDVLDKFEGFDILVNNAGIIQDAALMMMTKDQWGDVIETNLTGTFNMTKAAIVTFMKQKRGDVVNISSITGIKGMPRQTNYAASKGGIIAFTKALAKETAGYGVRANVVAPGFIETDMIGGLDEGYREKAIEQIPLKRFGNVDDVAGVVSFLLSEHAQYITGQVIQVDGGMGI